MDILDTRQNLNPMKAYSNTNYLGKSAEAWHGGVEWAEAKLKEKNGG